MYKKKVLRTPFMIIVRLSFVLIFFALSSPGANSGWAGQEQPAETYIAHVASFKNESNAGYFKIRLEKKGLTSWVRKMDIPGKGDFYRVYVGAYKNREAALSTLQKLKAEKIISYFAIEKEQKPSLPENVKNIQNASEVKDIQSKPASQLKKLEISPGPAPVSQERISEKTPPEQERKGPPREHSGVDRGSGQEKKFLVPEPAEAIPDTPEEPEGE